MLIEHISVQRKEHHGVYGDKSILIKFWLKLDHFFEIKIFSKAYKMKKKKKTESSLAIDQNPDLSEDKRYSCAACKSNVP